jgi:LPS sulfotransferase NodH
MVSGIFAAFPDFAELHAKGFAGLSCEKPVVMIAMTPRTGSTHLCAALAQTKGIAPPAEIFNPRNWVLHAEMARRGVGLFADYIRSFSADSGPCFFFKTSWQDFSPLATGYRQIFPNLQVVYLDRKDVIAQAVSLYRAAESGTWHVRRGETLAAQNSGALDHLNLSHLEKWLAMIEAEKRGWKRFFAAEQITPMQLFYEDFADDVTKAIAAIGDFLGIALNREIGPEIGFQKLGDEASLAWIERARRHVLRMT